MTVHSQLVLTMIFLLLVGVPTQASNRSLSKLHKNCHSFQMLAESSVMPPGFVKAPFY